MVMVCDENVAPVSANMKPMEPASDQDGEVCDPKTLACGQKRVASVALLSPGGGADKFQKVAEMQHLKHNLELREALSQVAIDTLEAYKSTIDATTSVSQRLENPGGEFEYDETGAGVCQQNDEDHDVHAEWKDKVTGVIMSYAACDSYDAMDGDFCIAEGDEDTDVPLHVTVEYQDPASGAMMGYALFDEDEDLQDLRPAFAEAEQVPYEAEMHASESESLSDDHSTETSSSSESQRDGDTETWSEDFVDETWQCHSEDCEATVAYVCGEWQDLASGTVLGYDACEDDDDVNQAEALALKVGVEWQDSDTGVMLGYAACDQGDEEVTLQAEK